MKQSEIERINQSLEKTKKAIVSFGCSFVAGQGALPLEILQNYNYVGKQAVIPKIEFTNKKQKNDFLKKYPSIKVHPDGNLFFKEIERENAFTHVLCKKYFLNNYTSINLGLPGNGNKASINQINFLPNIKWELIKELIVIYIPTDPARLGFVNDEFRDYSRFVTIWPHRGAHPGPKGKFWDGYSEAIYSEKFAYLEAINDISNLKNWANNFNHKMIIFPAFTDYRKEIFEKNILTSIRRNEHAKLLNEEEEQLPTDLKLILQEIIDNQWPWQDMWHPENMATWSNLIESFEDPTIPFYNYSGTGSPNYWVTSCMHPSAKAHDDIAQRLYKYITTELK